MVCPAINIAGAGVGSTTLQALDSSGSALFTNGLGANVEISNLTVTSGLTPAYGYRLFWANQASQMFLAGTINFVIGTGDIGIQSFGAFVSTQGTFNVSGNAFEVIDISDNGVNTASALIAGTWTITGTPTWTTGVFNGNAGCFINGFDFADITIGGSYSGSAVGKRYSLNGGSRLFAPQQTRPLSQTFFPGNAPGDVDGSSNYGGVQGPTPVTFANLPATPSEGMIFPVTNSNTATWGATITTTGAFHVLAYYDGSNWTVMAA